MDQPGLLRDALLIWPEAAPKRVASSPAKESPMSRSRRRFLQLSASTAAYFAFTRWSWPFAQSPPTIPLFGTNLRGIGTIGVAAPDPFPAPVTGVTHYTMNIDQFQDAGVVPSMGPTTLRG